MPEFDRANFPGKNEFDFAAAHFFVELHRGEKFFALHWIQIDLDRQTGALK